MRGLVRASAGRSVLRPRAFDREHDLPTLFKIAADAVVVLHFGYMAFVVAGQVAVLVGIMLGWRWIRNAWFRWLHLGSILIVAAEASLGITCPLTVWEARLRALSGQASYAGDFVGHWAHRLLFVHAPSCVFTLAYAAFALLVLATFLLAPPRRAA